MTKRRVEDMRRCEKCGTELAHGLCFVCPAEYSTISIEPVKMDLNTESLLKMIEGFKAEVAEREAKSRAEMQRLCGISEPEAKFAQEVAAELIHFPHIYLPNFIPTQKTDAFTVIDEEIEAADITPEQWNALIDVAKKRVMSKRFSFISGPLHPEPLIAQKTCPTCGLKHYRPFCYLCEPMPMDWGDHPDHDEAAKAASYQWLGRPAIGPLSFDLRTSREKATTGDEPDTPHIVEKK
jgi:hypothetical protein